MPPPSWWDTECYTSPTPSLFLCVSNVVAWEDDDPLCTRPFKKALNFDGKLRFFECRRHTSCWSECHRMTRIHDTDKDGGHGATEMTGFVRTLLTRSVRDRRRPRSLQELLSLHARPNQDACDSRQTHYRNPSSPQMYIAIETWWCCGSAVTILVA